MSSLATVGVFTPADLTAVIVGSIAGTYAWIKGPASLEGGNFILGFAAGTSFVYLTGMTIFSWIDGSVFDAMIHSNKVLVSGSFIYAAIMNIRTIPGLLPPKKLSGEDG